jgi:hypothetical protein
MKQQALRAHQAGPDGRKRSRCLLFAAFLLMTFLILIYVPSNKGTLAFSLTTNERKDDNLGDASTQGLLVDTQLYREEIEHLQQEIDDITASWDNFVTLTVNDTWLPGSYKELEKLMIPLLKKGLILIGDSTTRVLYGFLHCLMEGVYRNEDVKIGESRCRDMQNQLKTKCKEMENRNACESIASFSNYGTYLRYEPNYHLGAMGLLPKTKALIEESNGKFIFFGLPCLHDLWSPGGRERATRSQHPSTWSMRFEALYESISHVIGSNVPMIGTSVTLCDKKIGNELRMVHAYLSRENMTAELIDHYNMNGGKLLRNYTGPVPALTPFYSGHSADNATFSENGNAHCTKAALDALMRKSQFYPYLIDIRGVTKKGCNNTPDGRHYGASTLFNVGSLLLKTAHIFNMKQS